MALAIALSPALSEMFHTIKEYLDDKVYDTRRTAVPDFYEMQLIGTGASPFSEVLITDGDDSHILGRMISSSGGSFTFTFDPDYSAMNRFQALCEGARSGIIIFDAYRMLLVIYYYARTYLQILQAYAQAKQDNYIFDKVGDTLETKFITEQDTYSTALADLYDKMPIPLPFDIWDQSQDPGYVVQKSIEISEKGPVHASLYAMRDVFEGAGCEGVFIYAYENYMPMDLDYEHIPRRHPINVNQFIIQKGARRRYKWSIESLSNATTDKVIDIPTGTTYVWMYVDGEKDPDGTLTVKTSTTQPLPAALPTTGYTIALNVLTDNDEGSITGIPYQKYVELDPPAFSMAWSIYVYDEAGDLPAAELISREILALGAASPTGTITVEYEYESEPMILCVLKDP